MNNRVMLKISADDKYISLRTVSRKGRSPQRFVLLEKELEELEKERRVLTMDIHSFADLRRCRTAQGVEKLEIAFFWLSDSGFGDISGWKQTVQFPYGKFLECVEASRQSGGKEQYLLSMEENNKPRIEFLSRRNLKEVVNMPLLRKKLGRFLARNFNWTDYNRIVVTDDFVPYSFDFSGYTHYGREICGGIILHGQEDLKKAYYGMHT